MEFIHKVINTFYIFFIFYWGFESLMLNIVSVLPHRNILVSIKDMKLPIDTFNSYEKQQIHLLCVRHSTMTMIKSNSFVFDFAASIVLSFLLY
jgi:hypothetical protein